MSDTVFSEFSSLIGLSYVYWSADQWFLDVSSGFEDIRQRGGEQVDDGDEGSGISISAGA